MGRRSRKRPAPPAAERVSAPAPAEPVAPRTHAAPLRMRARLDEAPKPPWAPFPLVELCILVGLVLFVLGIAGVGGGSRRVAMLVGGLALVCLASLEVSMREHLSGYRSHTALLAGATALAVDVPLYFTKLPQEALLGVAVVVFALVGLGLRSVFRRRTGGMSFRA